MGRKTDFSHRAKFYRPDFRSAVCQGVWQQYLQSETVISFDVIFLETRSSAYHRSRNQNECARSHKLRVKLAEFENIRENQRKVVEAYLSGRDVLMITPTGSGKSLTFHIAPFAIDFFSNSLIIHQVTNQSG